MNKLLYYYILPIFSLISILYFSIYPLALEDIPALCPLNLEVSQGRTRIKKRRVYLTPKPVGILQSLLNIYSYTFFSDLFRGCLCGYLLLCSPAWNLSFLLGATVFCISSLSTIIEIIACFLKSERIKNLAHWYKTIWQTCYKIIVISLMCVIAIEVIIQLALYLREFFQVNTKYLPVLLFFQASMRIEENDEYRLRFSSQDSLKIESNADKYRITIGELSWEISKNNLFERTLFAVLIFSAVGRRGCSQVISLSQLGKALGWRNQFGFYRIYLRYKRTGDFSAIIPEAIYPHIAKLKSEALKIWLENIHLSVEQVRERLREQGINASLERIENALCFVNFNQLRTSLANIYENRRTYCKDVEIRASGEDFLIRLGNLYWSIKQADRFKWISLLYHLHSSRDAQGKKLFNMENLAQPVLNSKQHLHQFFEKYEILAKLFQSLNYGGPIYEKNVALTQQILEMWLEDITQSPQRIIQRLTEQGCVEKISLSWLRILVSSVDFMKIRHQIIKDYKQGKYRKETRWIMEKYQQIIEQLLQQLAENKCWSKAQIDRYVSDLSSSLYPPKRSESLANNHYFSKAWLKCFLFNLPKMLDGKICCRECGSFDTSQKTRVPKPHLITDPKTEQTVVVNSFRFHCNNPSCSLTTFSATDDGSHVLHEHTYAQACTMLRMVMDLGGSYSSVGRLLGVSKSTVFDQLTLVSTMHSFWHEILGVIHFSGTVCVDEKFVKIAQLKKSKGNRNFAYLFFAVDPSTYDLLHIDIYASRDNKAVVAFLTALKVQGIYPQVIMTDLFAGYDSAIKEVYGRSVTIAKCHFHFKKNIKKHMYQQFGKKDVPEIADLLQKDIFFVVDAKSKKTIRDRYHDLQKLKAEYLRREPKLLAMFECLDSYLPHLLRVIEHENVWIYTNNACELVIRQFNRRYKVMGGFESLETALRHARLFQLVHRFTPLSRDAESTKKGKAPLQLAGYNIEDMPIFQYLTQPLLFNLQPARNLALCKSSPA